MPIDRVWFVDQDVIASGDGSEAAPFETIVEAMAMIFVDSIYLETRSRVVPSSRSPTVRSRADGDPRPAIDGLPDYAGADVPSRGAP